MRAIMYVRYAMRSCGRTLFFEVGQIAVLQCHTVPVTKSGPMVLIVDVAALSSNAYMRLTR